MLFMTAMSQGVDRAIDAFIEGRMEFAQLRRALEVHLGRNPARREPAQKRLEAMHAKGRMSAALYAILTEELERSAFGDITAVFDAPDPSAAQVTLPTEATLPEEEAPAKPAPKPAPVQRAPSRPARPRREGEPSGKWAARAGVPATVDLPFDKTETDEETGEREAVDVATPLPEAAVDEGSAAVALAPRPQPARPPEPGPGSILKGRYELEALLGRGGISLVYRARDRRRTADDPAGSRVAVKLLAPEFAQRPDARRALAREAAQARRLSHPNVIRVLDMDNDGELPFLVMELLEGERLRSLLVRRYPDALPRADALDVIRGLTDALAHSHRRGVVHRDVKPANVYVMSSGEVRLLDFGLAVSVAASDGPSEPAMRARTPSYASPEMLAGLAASPTDDIYSLGCVAYEVLTGHHPFGKLPGDEANRRAMKIAPPAGLPARQWKVLKRCLSFTAAERPADAGAFAAEFFAPPVGFGRRPWVLAGFLGGLLVGGAASLLLAPDFPDLSERFDAVVESVGGAADPRDAPAPAEDDPTDAAEPIPTIPEPTGSGQSEPAPAQGQGAQTEGTPAATPRDEQLEEVELGLPEPARPTPDLPPGGSEAVSTPSQPARRDAQGSRPTGAPAAAAPQSPATATAELSLPRAEFRVGESASALRISVPRPAGFRAAMRAEWRTLQGTAGDPDDYVGSGWEPVTAEPGAEALVILIPIVSDSLPESNEVFFVDIRTADVALPVNEPSRARVVIIDDD